MLSLDRVNQAIARMGKSIKDQISQCAVSPLNAGPQYVEGFTFGQMQDGLSHYAILGHTLSCMSSPVDLPWIMYDAYQAVQSTGIHPMALAGMSNVDLVTRFGLAMITQHTGCALTSVYCTDYTINAVGMTCKVKETEDIAKTYSKLSLETQGLSASEARPWVSGMSKPTLGESIFSLANAQNDRRTCGLCNRLTPQLIGDDCENMTIGITMKGKGLANLFSLLSSEHTAGLAAGPATVASLVPKLVGMMTRISQVDKRFKSLTASNHTAMAPVLLRMGNMLCNGDWDNVLGVLSAKGAAYTEIGPDAPGAMSGHGAVIARIRDDVSGLYVHVPAEGTTYLTVDPMPPPGYATSIAVRLPPPQPLTAMTAKMDELDVCGLAQGRSGTGVGVQTVSNVSQGQKRSQLGENVHAASTVSQSQKRSQLGENVHAASSVSQSQKRSQLGENVQSMTGENIQTFELANLGTLMAQTIHRYVGVSADNCMLAHIKSDYSAKPSECPFYVAAFYTGLSEGGAGAKSLGCIPLDTNPPVNFGAGTRPLFGAPVLGLSHHSTMAVSVTPDLLADSPAESEEIIRLIREQVSEAWSPEASPETIAVIGSYWGPCESPDHPGIAFRTPGESAKWIRSENTWAFDNPDQTAHAVHLYQQLADRFNSLQANDPASDGAFAHAYSKYLSACLRVSLPIPRISTRQQPISFSFVRNLKTAAIDIGANKLAACPLKMAAIHARAKMDSGAHFYMCDKGNGPVHAHRVVLG
jgi:hypothetical protein